MTLKKLIGIKISIFSPVIESVFLIDVMVSRRTIATGLFPLLVVSFLYMNIGLQMFNFVLTSKSTRQELNNSLVHKYFPMNSIQKSIKNYSNHFKIQIREHASSFC